MTDTTSRGADEFPSEVTEGIETEAVTVYPPLLTTQDDWLINLVRVVAAAADQYAADSVVIGTGTRSFASVTDVRVAETNEAASQLNPKRREAQEEHCGVVNCNGQMPHVAPVHRRAHWQTQPKPIEDTMEAVFDMVQFAVLASHVGAAVAVFGVVLVGVALVGVALREGTAEPLVA